MNKPIKYDEALYNIIGVVTNMYDSLESYKLRDKSSPKYIELQENNIIKIYDFIECCQNIVDLRVRQYLKMIDLYRYECNSLYKNLFFYCQLYNNVSKSYDNLFDNYSDLVQKNWQLKKENEALKNKLESLNK